MIRRLSSPATESTIRILKSAKPITQEEIKRFVLVRIEQPRLLQDRHIEQAMTEINRQRITYTGDQARTSILEQCLIIVQDFLDETPLMQAGDLQISYGDIRFTLSENNLTLNMKDEIDIENIQAALREIKRSIGSTNERRRTKAQVLQTLVETLQD